MEEIGQKGVSGGSSCEASVERQPSCLQETESAGRYRGPITKLVPALSRVYRTAAGSHGDVALFTATTSSPSTRPHCKVALFSLQNNPPLSISYLLPGSSL